MPPRKSISCSKRLIFFYLLLTSVCSRAQSFTLLGTIAGKDTGIITLSYARTNGKESIDTTRVVQGKFQFSGIVLGADRMYLNSNPVALDWDPPYNGVLLVVPGTTHIAFRYGSLQNATITGARLQNEFDAYNKKELSETRQIEKQEPGIDSIRNLIKAGVLDATSGREKLVSLATQYAPLHAVLLNNKIQYIANHPDSYLSLDLIKFLIGRVSKDSVDLLYGRIIPELKNSALDYNFLRLYSRYKKAIAEEYPFDLLQVNQTAPDFSVYNTSADSSTLSAFSGKVLLLEFWELSCLPCLEANPYIENLRQRYANKGFTIIAINSGSTREQSQIIPFIRKKGLDYWTHVSINKDLNKRIDLMHPGDFNNYYSLGVPKTVLISRTGKIIYKTFGFSPEGMQHLADLIDKAVSEGR